MNLQALIYETTTGRLRRVIDPECECEPEFIRQIATTGEDESLLLREKTGEDNLLTWQSYVTDHTGLAP